MYLGERKALMNINVGKEGRIGMRGGKREGGRLVIGEMDGER